MGGLIGFALGYYLGLKEKPERIAELQQAFSEILDSREVQALLASAQTAASGLAARASEAREGGPADLSRAWQTITASEEFKAFVAGSTAFFEDIARRSVDTATAARELDRFDGQKSDRAYRGAKPLARYRSGDVGGVISASGITS